MRMTLEAIGSILYVAVHFPIVLFYIFGSTVLPGVFHSDTLPSYVAVIVLGYLFCIAVLRFLKGRDGKQLTGRMRFDCFLITMPVACLMTAGLMTINLPLHLESWNAHGFGVGGGTANVIFFPWLHGLLTVGLVKTIKHRV
jgi:hypothetical protein